MSEDAAPPVTGSVGGAEADINLGITPQATTCPACWMAMMCSPSAIVASATGSVPWKSTEPVAVALPVASAFRPGKAAKLALGISQVPACMVA
jgi:hypothetical protein